MNTTKCLFIGGIADGKWKELDATRYPYFYVILTSEPPVRFTDSPVEIETLQHIYRRKLITLGGDQFCFYVWEQLPMSELFKVIVEGYKQLRISDK